jgi:putative transposase
MSQTSAAGDDLPAASGFFDCRAMRVAESNVNRKRVRRLMRLMGIEAIDQKPNTSRKHPAHKIYPYLLRNLDFDHANQMWCADITYIPMAKGFVYLVAVTDWFSRKVLAWRLSITMETYFCVAALQEAMERYGGRQIFNTDQGRAIHRRGVHRTA